MKLSFMAFLYQASHPLCSLFFFDYDCLWQESGRFLFGLNVNSNESLCSPCVNQI